MEHNLGILLVCALSCCISQISKFELFSHSDLPLLTFFKEPFTSVYNTNRVQGLKYQSVSYNHLWCRNWHHQVYHINNIRHIDNIRHIGDIGLMGISSVEYLKI